MDTSAFRLLLDLDALFDTRMGTLICLNDNISQHIPIEEYRNRDMDDFEKLSNGAIKNSDYIERYKNRDYEVLSNSMTTGIIPIMFNYIDGLKERFFRGVDVSSVTIDINFYPYKLPGHIQQTMKDCLASIMPHYVSIGGVYVKPEEMDPDWIEFRYNGWITYDFHAWLEKHHERLMVKHLNSLAVILPRLFVEEPGKRVVEEEDGNFKPEDRHGQFEMIMEEFIHLEHIPPCDFCFLLPMTYRMAGNYSSSSES